MFVCPCALMSPTSTLPSFVLLQGEIGRPGSKVSCSSSLACVLLSLISPWSISLVLGIMGSGYLSPSPPLLSPLCILNIRDVICPLMCSEYPLQLLNRSCYISLSSHSNHVAKFDRIPGCLPSSSCSSPLYHSPLLSFSSASSLSLSSFPWPGSISPCTGLQSC